MIKERIEKMISNSVNGIVESAVNDSFKDGAIDSIVKKAMIRGLDAYRDHAMGLRDKIVEGLDIAIENNNMEEVKRVAELFRNFKFMTIEGMKDDTT